MKKPQNGTLTMGILATKGALRSLSFTSPTKPTLGFRGIVLWWRPAYDGTGAISQQAVLLANARLPSSHVLAGRLPKWA